MDKIILIASDLSKCKECNTILTDDNWYPSAKKKNWQICSKCAVKKGRYYFNRNYKRNRKQKNGYRHNLKKEVLTHYGNGVLSCVCCGFDDERALTVDHINGDGAIMRKLYGHRGVKLYFFLRRNGYPEGYRTLCLNCQWIEYVKRMEKKV